MTTLDVGERERTGRGRPVYTRVQVLGLLLVGVTTLVVGVVAGLSDPETLVFFGVVAAVAVLAAALAWRFGTWARVVGTLASVLVGGAMFWAAVGLTAPDSLTDFALAVGVVAGVPLGLGGGVAALVAGRLGRFGTAASSGERRLVRGVLAAVGAVLVLSAVLTVLGRGSVDAADVAGATRVEMSGFEFEPAHIRVGASDARLVVHNSDAFVHDLAVPELDALVKVTPGSTAALDLTGADRGAYTVYCTLHSDTGVDDPADAGMAALLVVE